MSEQNKTVQSKAIQGETVQVIDVENIEPHQVGPGITRRRLAPTEHARGWLIDFEPGSQWPELDRHKGEERYYVLSGELIEGKRRFGPGTYVVFAPGTTHRPRSEKGARMLGISIPD